MLLLLETYFTGSKLSCHGITLNFAVSQLNLQVFVLLIDGDCSCEKLASVPCGSMEVGSFECTGKGCLLGMRLRAVLIEVLGHLASPWKGH